MEFILFFTICFSMLLVTPCLALHTHDLQQANVDIEAHQFPRKLRVLLDNEKAFVHHHHHEDSSTSNMQKKDISSSVSVSGKAYKNEENVEVHKKRGTRQEWVEEIGEADTSQYFTMDYSHVRRRRPIHNKALPVGP